MHNERIELIKLFSKYEPSAWLIDKSIELGAVRAKSLGKKLNKLISYPSLNITNRQKTQLEPTAITYLDANWPKQLFDLDNEMPLVLWLSGARQLTFLDHQAVAVVGSKLPSLSVVKSTGQLLLNALTDCSCILSDNSIGINALAMQLGIKAGKTNFSVLAGGLDQIYPKVNQDLLRAIPKSGALISEYPLGAPVTKARLIDRNRVIAALSSLVIAIEPTARTGASNILYWADQLGREVIVV